MTNPKQSAGCLGVLIIVVTAGGVSHWVCERLIVVLFYGFHAYFTDGLHVTSANKVLGIYLSNGGRLSSFGYIVYRLSFLFFFVLAMLAAYKLIDLLRRNVLALTLIGLIGVAVWVNLIWQMTS